MSADQRTPRRVRGARHAHRPTREEVLHARRVRRIRTALYASSLGWTFFAAYAMSIWSASNGMVALWLQALIISPAVIAGLAGGLPLLPAYFYSFLIVAAPMMLFQWEPLIAIMLVSAAVMALGYSGLAVYCVLTGRTWSDLARREADAPRGVGGASTASGGVSWKRSATVVNSSPTGDEMPKRRTW